MKTFSLFVPLVLLLLTGVAKSQVQVDVKIARTLYMIYEPLLVDVAITNVSGRDLQLEDGSSQPWFGFEIFAGANNLVAPFDPKYSLDPLYIPMGKTVKRTVNLSSLYPLHEFGTHSIRANIYIKSLDRYYSSPRKVVEISEGRLVWSQTVGVPEATGSGLRTWSLLAHRLENKDQLYVRLADQDNARIITCFGVGPIMSFKAPEYLIDSTNQLHILQLVSPNTFLYTHLDLGGRVVARESWFTGKVSSPHLVREESGLVRVKGGIRDSLEPGAKKPVGPKLSDRPVPLPR